MFSLIEKGIAGTFQRGLYFCRNMQPLQNQLRSVPQIQRDTERPTSFVMMCAQLLETETRKHQYSMNTKGKSGTYITDTVTNPSRVTHLQTHHIPPSQTLSRAPL